MAEHHSILLTGATGFIGSHVLEALLEAGLPVAALVRSKSILPDAGVERRTGDLRDSVSLSKAVRGCGQVIHVAALANDWSPAADFHAVNVQGTLNLLEACLREGVEHVIITGSISSYGEENCPRAKDETSPFNSHYPYFLHRAFPSRFNEYRDSKAQATRQAMTFARRHRLQLTILEPVWVYGEREFHTGFFSYVQAVKAGVRWMPGSDSNSFHVIYAKDLAQAYLQAARRRPPGVERIIVGNPHAENMARIFSLLCLNAGLPAPRHLPWAAVYPVGLAMELYGTLTHQPEPPLLTRARINMFYDSIGYSTQKAASLLGFAPRYSLEEGIARTVHWYKQHGYL